MAYVLCGKIFIISTVLLHGFYRCLQLCIWFYVYRYVHTYVDKYEFGFPEDVSWALHLLFPVLEKTHKIFQFYYVPASFVFLPIHDSFVKRVNNMK